MKFLNTFLTIFLVAQTITAQTITGIVLDQTKQTVEFANVALYSLPDSVLLTGTVTDENGEFSVNTKEYKGDSYLQVSFLGYKTSTVDTKLHQIITLMPDNTQLGELIVTASRKLYKLENGSIVANVKNTVLETLTTANEVIEQLPFMSGKNGDFTVFGRGTPAIYINNRLVRDNKELEQLSPSDITNIKVITSPGAAYDATINAVIKITTEKPVGEGLSGMLYATAKQASVFSGGEYVFLNYRTGAWDIFGSTFYNHNKFKTNFEATQIMSLADNEHQQIYLTNESGSNNSLNSVAGVNYNPNNKHSAGVRYTNYNNTWEGKILNDITHIQNNIEENVIQQAEKRSPGNTHNINAYYNGTLTEKLSANINSDIVMGNANDNMDAFYTQTPNEVIRTRGTRDNKLYAVKGILSYNLNKSVLDFGTEYSHTNVLQSYNINDKDLGIDNTNDKAIQNRLAFFATYQFQLGKIGISTGLRYENIVMDYYQNETKSDEQSKKYNMLFPNISFSYSHNNIQTIAGFERKIAYPSYYQLRSNIQYSSPFIYESGNPFLQPKIENRLFMMVAWKDLQAMMGYSLNENAMHHLPQQFKDEPVILLRDENIKQSRGTNIGISYSPTYGIWRPQFEAGAVWQSLEIEGINRNYNSPIYSGKWFNTFSLPQKWTLRLNASGNSAGHSGIAFLQPSWGIDLRITKRLLEDKLSIQLAAVDIFKTNTLNWDMDYGNINMLYDKNIDSRYVSITVSYSFNSTTNKYKGQQSSEEINRL